MSTSNSMEELSVAQLMAKYNLIVPEIQREYVWGNNEFDILDTFIQDIKEGYASFVENNNNPSKAFLDLKKLYESSDSVNKEVLKKAIDCLNNSNSINIGFLYSYRPDYYVFNDRNEDVYLIDGQQRFTTLFLLLFYFSVKENKNIEFVDLFRFDEKIEHIAFDYRVRTLTHNFIIDLISKTEKIVDLIEINGKNWFLSNYCNDVTVRAFVGGKSQNDKILGAFPIFHRHFASDTNQYFDYVKNQIKFWHFKTEETSQGEELYITMNSRGQQLADNETIRAKLFESDGVKDEQRNWSEKWEQWQDFFWKHRNKIDKTATADKGFNEFLACIGGLNKYLLGDKELFYSKETFDKSNQIKTTHIIKSIKIHDIEKYLHGLQYLETNKCEFKNLYNYSEWVDQSIQEIWNILNIETINWYADYSDRDRATERNRMVYLWSILYYLAESDLEQVNVSETFRLLRLYYIRYKNFNRSVTTIKKTINLILINGVLDSIDNEISGDLDENGNIIEQEVNEETDQKARTEEEILKIDLLNKFIENIDLQKQHEELVWQIEDHKINLDGRDVGGINISHLVDFNSDVALEYLQKVKDKFYELFPVDQKEFITIQNILLYYGKYWHWVSPTHYTNYEFDNWKKIIRNIGDNKADVRFCFKNFFKDFLEFDGAVESFLQIKRSVLINPENVVNLESLLLYYNQYLDDDMWEQGNHIAFSIGNPCSLVDWESKDRILDSYHILYNIKGNLQGGSPQELFQILPEDIKKIWLQKQ